VDRAKLQRNMKTKVHLERRFEERNVNSGIQLPMEEDAGMSKN